LPLAAPCLSFDIIPDDLGNSRADFPHTCYLVAGTQAETSAQNNVIVMKLSNMKRTFKEQKQTEDSDDSDSEDEDDQPDLEAASISHSGCVNRIRVLKYISADIIPLHLFGFVSWILNKLCFLSKILTIR